MNARHYGLLSISFAAILLGTSCSPARQPDTQATGKPNYNEIKSMVVDILRTKDGQDTLKQILTQPDVRKELAVTPADVQAAIQQTLTSDQGKSVLQEQLKDPKFAQALVSASKQQHAEILKNTLMKDPEYQQQMITLMKTPDFQKSLMTLMETPEYRQQSMKIMQEALQNPQFKLMFMDTVKQAVQASGGGGGGKGQQQGGQGKGQGKQSGGGGGDQESS